MRTLLLLILTLSALPAHAQVYKWTDADGKIHYSDQPQDGVDARQLRGQAATITTSNDDWRERERERVSRDARMRQAEADKRIAKAEGTARAKPAPFNPTVNRSSKPMSDDELCTRDSQQIEFAEQTRNMTITHGNNKPQQLTEAQRQEVIRERKANHAQACGSGRRR